MPSFVRARARDAREHGERLRRPHCDGGTPRSHTTPATGLTSRPAAQAALGAIKLRGHYAHESPAARGERSRMYVRHHAFSLLALTLLGGLAWSCVENKPDVAGLRSLTG